MKDILLSKNQLLLVVCDKWLCPDDEFGSACPHITLMIKVFVEVGILMAVFISSGLIGQHLLQGSAFLVRQQDVRTHLNKSRCPTITLVGRFLQLTRKEFCLGMKPKATRTSFPVLIFQPLNQPPTIRPEIWPWLDDSTLLADTNGENLL